MRPLRDPRPLAIWAISALALAGAMALLCVVRFWVLSDPYPPGLDGAQWLAYGRALAGGAGRSADSTYAPLIPIAAYRLSLTLGPELGLRVVAIVVLLLLAVAAWLLGICTLGVTWGSLATALVLPSTAMAETFYYGGYPQQASLAFGILGMAMLLTASRTNSQKAPVDAFALASVAFLLASVSHLLFGPLFLVSATLFAISTGATRPDRVQFLRRTALSLTPALAASAAVAHAFVDRGYRAPLDVSQRTLTEAWVYATRESPGLWAAVVVGTFTILMVFVASKAKQADPYESMLELPVAVVMGVALAAPSGVLLVMSGQPRLAPPFLLGSAMLFAFACRQTARRSGKAVPIVLAGWVVSVVWLAWVTTGLVREFATYYQVLDASLIAAISSIPDSNNGSIAVAADRRGWPVGWWVEALQDRPVFTGSNPQWLAFPEERSRAASVARLLASEDLQILQERASELGVEYLLMRKWDWIGWERWTDGTTYPATFIYDDNETLVMEIPPLTP